MNSRQLFGVAIRICGLALLVLSVFDLIGAIKKLTGIGVPSAYSLAEIALAGLLYFFLGAMGFFRADWFVRLSYGREQIGQKMNSK